MKNVMNLDNFSSKNLKRIQGVLKIILDALELRRGHSLIPDKIPLKRFEEEESNVLAILEKINENNNIVEVFDNTEQLYQNLQLHKRLLVNEEDRKKFSKEMSEFFKKDLKNYILLRVNDLDVLRRTKENVDKKLKAFKEQEEGVKKEKTIKKDYKKHRIIQKITIIKMNNGKLMFAINDNYKETKKISGMSEWWQIFIKEIKDRKLLPETRTNVREITKGMKDYFIYNKKCSIYFNGKYELIDVFIGRNQDVRINADIKTETISEKKYLRRKKRNKS